MANNLYTSMMKNANSNVMEQFNRFRQSFHGDPQQTIQQMLNSGRITQAQYNQAVQKANMLKGMFGIK